jgi:polyferredoxin
MTYDWPGNMDELDVVVRRAVNVAQSDILMPEDLFIGLAPIEGKIVFNLIKLEKVRKILQSKLYPAIPQMVIGLILGLLILTGLIGSQNPDSNIFVVLFWGIGWPLLVFSWFLFARSWCTLCPMGGLSDFFNRHYSLRLNVPSFLRKYGVYLSAAGFGIIIWLEVISSMPFSPRSTSLLLLFIAFFAVTSGLLFHRRAWCRFLCPLGNLTGILSRCSIMELRGNINVCNNECATHGCYVGEGKLAGCPMYEGPFSLQSNHHCILCGNCVKICTKQAPRLNLRLPGHELWTVLKPDHAMAVFVPLLIGTQLFRGLEHSKLFIYIESVLDQHLAATALLLIGSIILTYLFVTAAGILTFTRLRDSSTSKANLMVYALLPLTFAFELGFQLKPLLERTGMLIPVLGRQIGFAWESLGMSTSPVMVKAIQIMIVLIGAVGSRTILNRLVKQHEQDYSESKKWRLLWPMLTVSLVYIYLFATG